MMFRLHALSFAFLCAALTFSWHLQTTRWGWPWWAHHAVMVFGICLTAFAFLLGVTFREKADRVNTKRDRMEAIDADTLTGTDAPEPVTDAGTER